MNRYFEYALAPSTRSTYRSGLNSYSVFCKQLRASRFPLQEINLQLFVTSLATRVKYSTIKVYLSGIQYQSITLGFDTKISDMGKLYYVLRGIWRLQCNGSCQRLPITPQHLRDMITFIENSLFTSYDKAMWKGLILVAFFGLLRVSEYVC